MKLFGYITLPTFFGAINALTMYLAFSSDVFSASITPDSCNSNDSLVKQPDIQPVFSKCPIIMNYECHHDKAPVQTIISILPQLIEKDYTTFVFEEKDDWSIDRSTEALNDAIYMYEAGFKKSVEQLRYVKQYLEENPDQEIEPSSLMRIYTAIYMTPQYIESYNITINLYKLIEKMKLNYTFMDLPEAIRPQIDKEYSDIPGKAEQVRSHYMVAKIEESCQRYPSGHIVTVGVFHNDIETELRAKGYPVLSIYIMNHSLIIDPSLPIDRQNNDEMLRTQDQKYIEKYGYEHVKIINIFDYPEINAAAEILPHLGLVDEPLPELG